MRVTTLGHSGLLVEAAQQCILVDPILREGSFARGLLAIDPPRKLRLDRLPQPTVLVITHAHSDHFDLPSLGTIDRRTPIALPPDPRLEAELRGLGFDYLRVLTPDDPLEIGRVTLGATPSLKPNSDEMGLLVHTDKAAFWNIADTEVDASVACALLANRPAIDVVAARFQPIRRVLGTLTRGAGASFDKTDVVRWLEAACAAKPRVVFPYGAGLSLRGRAAWLNRYLFPFREAEIARLLSERLTPSGTSLCMQPGDVLEVLRGKVRHIPQASAFVRSAAPSRRADWQPIDATSFGALRSTERRELVRRLEAILSGPFAAWLRLELARNSNIFSGFVEWGVVWQLVVHMGRTRATYAIDFGARPWRLIVGRHERASYFFHCSGDGLHRVLCRRGGAEWLLSAGDDRFCEKILTVKDGVLAAPSELGVALYERLPDPFLVYLANCELG